MKADRLLKYIDLSRGDGLEIGALCNPVVPPNHPRISYLDHLDTAGLRKKYENDPNVNIDAIVPVDFVWDERTLVDTVGAKHFAYVIASHVAEHVPDLIGWFKQVSQILTPDGLLVLVIPDMRYTFDCQRKLTTISELVEAYFLQYQRPSIRQIVDHFVHKVEVPERCSVSTLWRDPYSAAFVPRSHPRLLEDLGEEGLRAHFDNVQRGEYIDSHCTVVTPGSFLKLISQTAALDLCPFTVKHLEPTQPDELDFLVVLEKLPVSIATSKDRDLRRRFIVDSLPGIERCKWIAT